MGFHTTFRGKNSLFKIIRIAAFAAVGIMILLLMLVIGYLKFSAAASRKIYKDVSQYASYRSGEGAIDNFTMVPAADWIFPENITADMDVQEFFLMYYNPWDANYLGFVTVTYEEKDYQTEVDRLSAYSSTEYIGCYGATGFADYHVLAMDASDSGFVYAITDGSAAIIYVEMVFPGYGMDINYEKYIPQEYLPEGLDISEDNPTRQTVIE